MEKLPKRRHEFRRRIRNRTPAPFKRYVIRAVFHHDFRLKNAVNKYLPITFHKIVCPDRMKFFDPNGEKNYLEKMQFINQTFEKLAYNFQNVQVFSPTSFPKFNPDCKGNGLFIEDCVHFTPEVNGWIAGEIIKEFQNEIK